MELNNSRVAKAILTTKGRKTSREHSVWLRGVLYDGKIYFSRHRLDGDWIKNALANPDVKVRFDDSSYAGRAKLVTDENLARKISNLKYPGEERAKEKRVVLEVMLN